MPVPASITDLSTTAGSNSPPGSESPATIDDYLRTHAAFIAQLRDGKLPSASVSTFMLTLLDDADAAAARTTLGAHNAANLTTGTLPDERISSSGPTSPTLVNSFTNGGACRYWKIGGIVYVSVDLSRSTTPANATTAFTLPAGFRPAVAVAGSGEFAQTSPLVVGISLITVSTGGVVTVNNSIGGTPGSSGYALSALLAFPAA